MPKGNPEVQVPGAAGPAEADTPKPPEAPKMDPRDAEIAALRAQLAASTMPALVMEADGPNTRKYKAESKHLHLTSAELGAMVKSGQVKMTEHHVLCKDGWFVNPAANIQANG